MRARCRDAAAALLLAGALGCATVPDITFVVATGDAGATDATAPADASSESEAATPDAEADVLVPPADGGGFTCPNGTPCEGACTAASCTKCGTCQAGEVCCAKQVNALCKPPSTCK